jgi:cytochrome o ubiquinol oxidase subunit II
MTNDGVKKFFSLKRPLSFFKRALFISIGVFLCVSMSGCMHSHGVLNPDGVVALKERSLLFDALAIMMIVVIPTIILSIVFALRYRNRHNNKSKYRPNWAHNTLLEAVWWGVPTVIIIALGILTWTTSHSLDPYRHISAQPTDGKVNSLSKKPLIIQAVSLRWKWLFIYPKQGIATVNTITLPAGRPVEFKLTSEAPMSAFFIPRLSSQIYVMAGMQSKLNLIADKVTTSPLLGRNAQYNGPGFSWNTFSVNVVQPSQFKHWAASIKGNKSYHDLTVSRYVQSIWRPINSHVRFPKMYFSGVKSGLYMCIMQKYHLPLAENSPFSKLYYRKKLESGKWGNSCAYELYKLVGKYPHSFNYESQPKHRVTPK